MPATVVASPIPANKPYLLIFNDFFRFIPAPEGAFGETCMRNAPGTSSNSTPTVIRAALPRKVFVAAWLSCLLLCNGPTSIQAAGDAAVAWGPVVAGLRAGLVPPAPSPAADAATADSIPPRGGEPIAFTILLENAGTTTLRLPGSILLPWHWRIDLLPDTGGPPLRALLHPPLMPLAPTAPFDLAPGARKTLAIVCAHWIEVGDAESAERIEAIHPRGTYRAFADHESPPWETAPGLWRGKIVTGEARVLSFSN